MASRGNTRRISLKLGSVITSGQTPRLAVKYSVGSDDYRPGAHAKTILISSQHGEHEPRSGYKVQVATTSQATMASGRRPRGPWRMGGQGGALLSRVRVSAQAVDLASRLQLGNARLRQQFTVDSTIRSLNGNLTESYRKWKK